MNPFDSPEGEGGLGGRGNRRSPNDPHEGIAIVGIGAIFPGSRNVAEYWRDITNATDRITDVPPTHWHLQDFFDADPKALDKTYSRRGGFLPLVDFDPLKFGIPPHSLPATDTGQILGLIVAQQVLDDFCRNRPLGIPRERIGVILGTTGATELIMDMAARMEKPKWRLALAHEGFPEEQIERICERIASYYPEWQENTFPGLLSNVVSGRIAHRLNLQGTNLVTDVACASSLAAVHLSINELLLGQSDLVITGGVDTLNTILMYMCFSKTPALSPTQDCRPFSDDADGTVIGEGVGMIALRRLEDAKRDNDFIYAVIKGVGSSSDGLGKSIYAPTAKGQARAMWKAYDQAAYGPNTVELVEAHGTGTSTGDTTELESLTEVFSHPSRSRWCALGSVKSQIGHTKAAAGIAGLIKAALALHYMVLPPTLKISQPHKMLCHSQTPFYLNTSVRPWKQNSQHPRRASVSAFGFGGANYHVTLEEWPYAQPETTSITKKSTSAFTVKVSGVNIGKFKRERGSARGVREPSLPSQSLTGGQEVDMQLQAFQQTQQELFKIHQDFQQSLVEAHKALLKTTETCLLALLRSPSVITQMETPSLTVEKNIEARPLEAPKPIVQPQTQRPVADHSKLLLSVVSEKTGYPEDSLNLDMSLEEDLGIDSIKRVEILSSLSDSLSELSNLDNTAMGKVRTLRDILKTLNQTPTSVEKKSSLPTPSLH